MRYVLCPVCKKPLRNCDNGAVCENGHLFDRAKEGYLNLLLPSEKNSKLPGDNAEMVRARRLFLQSGSYAPLADELSEIVNSAFENRVTLVDAGVGTGYYLHRIISGRIPEPDHCNSDVNDESVLDNKASSNYNYLSLPRRPSTTFSTRDAFIGADISKEAVRVAAKLNPEADCFVASVFSLPLPDSFADVVTCVFSPFATDEYRRILKNDGLLITVSPAEEHLIELRRALYENVRPVETQIDNSGFSMVSEKNLTYTFNLENKELISALIKMTPYAYRAPKDRLYALECTDKMSFTANFKICILQKQY